MGPLPSAIRAVPRPAQVVRLLTRRPVAVAWRVAVGEAAPAPVLRHPVDTFGFRNDSRIHHRGKPDLYANWCIVIARAVTQFQRFARFDPAAPRLPAAACTDLVRRIVALPPWEPPWPDEARVTVPGYATLHEFTRAEEPAVKAGLGGRFWTWVHPTNWRMALPSPPGEQARTAMEIIDEVRAGRAVQLFITDFPRIKVNHSVLVYDYRVPGEEAVEFVVYDPNDAHAPGRIRFDRRLDRFVPAPLIGVDVPWFRAFRIYYSNRN